MDDKDIVYEVLIDGEWGVWIPQSHAAADEMLRRYPSRSIGTRTNLTITNLPKSHINPPIADKPTDTGRVYELEDISVVGCAGFKLYLNTGYGHPAWLCNLSDFDNDGERTRDTILTALNRLSTPTDTGTDDMEAAFDDWWIDYQTSLSCSIQFDDDSDNLEFMRAAYKAGKESQNER